MVKSCLDHSWLLLPIDYTLLLISCRYVVQTKWCPAPGCEYAVEFIVGGGSYDVSCGCSYGFCWNVSSSWCSLFCYMSSRTSKWEVAWQNWQCTEEAHRPVDCSTVSKWVLKNSAESENMNWYGKDNVFLLYFQLCCRFLLNQHCLSCQSSYHI
jgi:hypothetical protein